MEYLELIKRNRLKWFIISKEQVPAASLPINIRFTFQPSRSLDMTYKQAHSIMNKFDSKDVGTFIRG